MVRAIGISIAAQAAAVLVLSGLGACASDSPSRSEVTAAQRERAAENAAAAEVLLEQGDIDGAYRFAQAVLEDDPYEAENGMVVARAMAARAESTANPRLYQQAMERADFAVRADPDDPELRVDRGRLLFRRKHFTRALVDFRHAVDIDPKNSEALLMLAWTHRGLGQAKAERQAWERYLQVVPDDDQGLLRVADLLGDDTKEDRERRIDLVRRAAVVDPTPEALHRVANLEAKAGNWAAAEALLLRAAAASSGQPEREADVLFNLGASQQQQGKAVSARASYQRSLELNPDDPRALGNLGILLIESGDVELGRRFLQDAIERTTDDDARDRMREVLDSTRAVSSAAMTGP